MRAHSQNLHRPARMRNPFIVGSWVRGEHFFGRSGIINEIFDGPRDALWVVGPRRLGKTSLLKELEYRAQRSPHCPFVPLYWDLEGSADPRGLAESLVASVEDCENFRRSIDLSIDEVEGLSVTDLLTTLVRKTVRSGWRLLLLLDEAEEFLTVARNDSGALLRLRRIFHRGPELRTVLTSTRRLGRIDMRTDFVTSPFLQGFAPPVYLTPFSPDEALALLARGDFTPETVRRIMNRTANHPFLLQLVASRLYDGADISTTLEQIAADEMIASFFSNDFQALDPAEQEILSEVARLDQVTRQELTASATRDPEVLALALFALRTMGYLALDDDKYRIGNSFFKRWLVRARPSSFQEKRPS
ncbi:MAG: AAA family ATPase [Vicinamibacteria bacterium]|nr:AAA family ATPase [Vicinamibacteria bacterium]